MNIDTLNTIIIVGCTLLAAVIGITVWDILDTRRRRKATIRKAHAVIRDNIQSALDGDASAMAQVLGASEYLNRMEGRP